MVKDCKAAVICHGQWLTSMELELEEVAGLPLVAH